MRDPIRLISYRRPLREAFQEELQENIRRALESEKQGGQIYEVWIRRRHRSTDQNDYFHKMCRDISKNTGASFSEVKHWLVFECFGAETFEFNGKKYEKIPSTSELPIDQMTLLISHTEPVHAEFG
jgi:hypothetical protein